MPEHNHERDHEHEHIPPPDLPRHKTVMGFKPHIFIGGLVLIAILIIYLLLLVRPGIYSPAPPKPTPTSRSTPWPTNFDQQTDIHTSAVNNATLRAPTAQTRASKAL